MEELLHKADVDCARDLINGVDLFSWYDYQGVAQYLRDMGYSFEVTYEAIFGKKPVL